MRKAVFVVSPALVVLSALCFNAQAPPPQKPMPKANEAAASPCPKVEIQSSQGRLLRDGQPVTFGANISGGDPNVIPTIIWNVSAGSIRDGQGTRRIEVDSTGAGTYREIVADLWIGGYAPECASQATAAVRVVGPAVKVGEFGDLPADKEGEHVASVAAAVSQTNDNLYVIAYAGRTNVRGYAYNALRRIKASFVAAGLSAQRIGTIDGGFREQSAYELWIVPEGAEPPRPAPTVDRKEIVYPKTTPARKP